MLRYRKAVTYGHHTLLAALEKHIGGQSGSTGALAAANRGHGV